MVKLFPNALLLALLVGEPAMAVDYLNCEAMQRAYARLVNQRVDFIIKNFEPSKTAKLADLCTWRSNPMPDPINDQAVERWLEIEKETLEKYEKCLFNPENMAIAKAAAYKKINPMNREKLQKSQQILKPLSAPNCHSDV